MSRVEFQFNFGDRVRHEVSGLVGRVTGLAIYDSGGQDARVTRFEGGDLKHDWLAEATLTPEPAEVGRIGFSEAAPK